MRKKNMRNKNNRIISAEKIDEIFDSGSDEINHYIAWDKGYCPGHGGARVGAGRKLSGRIPYLTRLHPAIIRKIKRLAGKRHASECEVVELALKKALA
jgi:hypothetical protein